MTTTAQPPAPGRARRARWRLLVLLPLVALVLGSGLWWWSHPRAFPEAGGGAIVPGEPGRPTLVVLTFATDGPRATLLDARPRVVSDDTGATVTVHACHRPDSRDWVGAGPDVDEICAELRDPQGPLAARDQLVLEVVPQGPGRVVVDGVDVSYRTGLQQGTQWTGIDVIVEVGDDEVVW